MKAVVAQGYGSPDVLRLEEVEKPTAGERQVLIRIRAASVNPFDWGAIRGTPAVIRLVLGLNRPRMRPGRDVAGRVEDVGSGVTRFKPGDEVFGLCYGSLAEYGTARESNLVAKPANVSFEEAAAVPLAGLTALQGLRDHGRIQAGQRVLINGAAGGIGTLAVQIAGSFGADVTGVCSTRNVEMVRSLGAGRVVDYTREDFTRGGERYDMIFDLVTNHPFSECRRVLAPRGTLVAAGAGGADHPEFGRRMGRVLSGLLAATFGTQRMAFFMTHRSQEDLATLAGLLESGRLRPAIDSRHPLAETSEAFRRLSSGHARGKVVVTVA